MQVSRDKVAIVGFRLKGLESISGWPTLERSCSKPVSETQKKLKIWSDLVVSFAIWFTDLGISLKPV